jgi:hypothetical protein
MFAVIGNVKKRLGFLTSKAYYPYYQSLLVRNKSLRPNRKEKIYEK